MQNDLEVDADNLNTIESYVKYWLRVMNIPADLVIVKIVSTHDEVRNILNLPGPLLNYSEKPVKLIVHEDDVPILSISKNVTQLRSDELFLEIGRELTLYKVLTDPELINTWSIPEPCMSDKYANLLSIALMLRLTDKLIADTNHSHDLSKLFNKELFREVLSHGSSDHKLRAIEVLSIDVPLSIELSGNVGLARSLYDECVKYVDDKEFLKRYDDFRDFVRNNFNFENAYSYLDLIFKTG